MLEKRKETDGQQTAVLQSVSLMRIHIARMNALALVCDASGLIYLQFSHTHSLSLSLSAYLFTF